MAIESKQSCALALRPMEESDRMGAVEHLWIALEALVRAIIVVLWRELRAVSLAAERPARHVCEATRTRLEHATSPAPLQHLGSVERAREHEVFS